MFSHAGYACGYFDTHLNGDIMGYYTNDIGAIASDDLVSTAPPPLWSTPFQSSAIMFHYSALVKLLVILFGASLKYFATKNLEWQVSKEL